MIGVSAEEGRDEVGGEEAGWFVGLRLGGGAGVRGRGCAGFSVDGSSDSFEHGAMDLCCVGWVGL